jgi:membrane fusion protein (multidrug efflux system)
MDVIQTAIRKTEIRAPFSGRLGLRSISMGAYVTPQTVIAAIQQVEKLKLEFTIPEKYTSNVKVGQKVTFTTESIDKKYTASIIATEAAVTETNRSLRIRAVVTAKDPKLIPGSFAKVAMDFGSDNDALLIPSQAVIPGARNKQVIVYRNGVAKFTIVGTGVRDSSQVQITSGLVAGDTVVTTGLLSIKPEGKVKISRISNAQNASKPDNKQISIPRETKVS